MESALKKVGKKNSKITANAPSPHVPLEEWGRDHWSTFAYAETCVVDHQPLDRDRLRCNGVRHAHLVGPTVGRYVVPQWQRDWGTRLSGFYVAGKSLQIDPSRRLADHDDWDCLEDMENAGLLEIVSVANTAIVLTAKGLAVAGHLRKHKATGGAFSDFKFKPEMVE